MASDPPSRLRSKNSEMFDGRIGMIRKYADPNERHRRESRSVPDDDLEGAS